MENQLKELNNIQKQITNMRERHNNNLQVINNMMTTKQKYQNSKIYAIKSFQTNDVYYGSTTKSLSKRLSRHKEDYRRWQKNKYHYVTSYEVMKFDDCYIELYELYPCNSKTELERREGQIIRANVDAINQRIAGRTKKEYDRDNVDNKKKYDQQYRKANRDKINEKHNCVCGVSYIKRNKTDHLKTVKHQNYVNGIVIEKSRVERHDCICGGVFTNSHKSDHLKSKKHLKHLESLI
jgi:hypothetical protein